MKKIYLLFGPVSFVLLGIFISGSCKNRVEQTSPSTASVIIDDSHLKSYSSTIFGGFIEHFQDQVYGGIYDPGSPLSNEDGFRMDVADAIKELNLTVVRWSGGCFASGYHWKNGVGKVRKPVPDPVWGVVEPNIFGTDEFVKLCRLIGCKPYICTNVGNGTPQEMKEWVEYYNSLTGQYADQRKENGHAEPYNIKYWSIGNENWGEHERGASTPEKWGPLVRESAELTLDADSTLILAAAATTDKGWTLPLLKAAGEKLDLVAVHNYWLPLWGKNEIPDYKSCIVLSEDPQHMFDGVVSMLDSAGYREKIKIAFDEWNLRGWHHPSFPRKEPINPSDTTAMRLIQKRDINKIPYQYSMADALFSASFMNACLRHSDDVEMTNIAPVVNTRGPLFVNPNGIVKRTTFHTLAMYANLLERNVASLSVISDSVRTEKRGVPDVDAIATTNDSKGNWSVALINRHPDQTITCTLRIGEWLPDGEFNATVLQGDSPEAYNDIENPERVKPETIILSFKDGVVILSPHSLSMI